MSAVGESKTGTRAGVGAHPGPAGPPYWSLLRLGALQRLAAAAFLSGLLWLAVWWAIG